MGEHIVFKDSLMFMNASLERLGKNLLAAGRHHFNHLLIEFHDTPNAAIDLLLRKGIYPYDYMDDMGRFDETALPTKDNFFNKLRDQACSDDNYANAVNVWTTFNCTTMKDYHDLYLKSMCTS